MLRISDGRKNFYQWDLNQKLIVDDFAVTQVHYCNSPDGEALVVEVKNGLADVPNIFLTECWTILAFAFDGNSVIEAHAFKVEPRAKPVDYIYTPTEVKTWDELNDKINDLSADVKETQDAIRLDYSEFGIPVLSMAGDAYGMSKENKVELDFTFGDRVGKLTCKWQGTSSIAYPKKNYNVEFDNAFEAKTGWGEQTKYCLKANWVDASSIRNIFGATLWGKMLSYRSSADERLKSLPNGGAIDGFPIWVIINGKSMGLYTMNIPKDAWLFGMTGSNPLEGFICAEDYKCDCDAIGDGSDISIEYCCGNENELISSFNNMIHILNSVSSEDDLPALEAVLDIGSVIDYYVHCCFIRNYDGIFKNYIFATYDGIKWFISAYDMDSIFGNSWDASGFGWANDYPSFTNLCESENKLFPIVKKYYANEIKSSYQLRRYWEFGETDLTATAYKIAHQIPQILMNEDFRLWPNRPGTHTSNLEQILSYAKLRGTLMDYNVTLM